MAMAGGALALEDAEAGPPPVLLPAAIFRQLLFDPAELTPAWLRPRPVPEPDPAEAAGATIDATAPADVLPTDVPKPAKRTRRPKSDGTASPSRPRSRRVAKVAKQDPAASDH